MIVRWSWLCREWCGSDCKLCFVPADKQQTEVINALVEAGGLALAANNNDLALKSFISALQVGKDGK